MTPALHEEFAALETFSTTRFYGQLVEPLKPITYTTTTYAHLRWGGEGVGCRPVRGGGGRGRRGAVSEVGAHHTVAKAK